MSEPSSMFRPLGFSIVTGLATALLAMLVARPLPEAQAEAPNEHEAVDETESESAAETEIATAPEPEPPPEPEPVVIEPRRPLRVTALGWELLGPGVIANDGLLPGEASDFRRAGLAVELAVAHTPEQLAAQLA